MPKAYFWLAGSRLVWVSGVVIVGSSFILMHTL